MAISISAPIAQWYKSESSALATIVAGFLMAAFGDQLGLAMWAQPLVVGLFSWLGGYMTVKE
jgi:hypothetical protein